MNMEMIKLVLYAVFVGGPLFVGKVALEELARLVRRRK